MLDVYTSIYMRMLYSQYDEEWSAVEYEYGNVNEFI